VLWQGTTERWQRPGRDNRLAGTGPYALAKRGLDLTLGLALLVLTAPLTLLAMLLVKLTSRGPALYTQVRVGLGGRPFTIFKVRTMAHQCEFRSGARWSLPGDTRVTAVGRFLRRTHLDELPQLWNVLRGDMSLIGPRPERPEFVPQLEMAVPCYADRLRVRPGLTGLAQVQLPPDSDLDSVCRKVACDLYYILHPGLLLDLRILAGTALHLVGVPWQLVRRLALLPRRGVIDATYQTLCAGDRPAGRRRPEVQPADKVPEPCPQTVPG
jgi:lipopolysaccharide/colanic/teichoic acid biosynthesis glycosyltransferase